MKKKATIAAQARVIEQQKKLIALLSRELAKKNEKPKLSDYNDATSYAMAVLDWEMSKSKQEIETMFGDRLSRGLQERIFSQSEGLQQSMFQEGFSRIDNWYDQQRQNTDWQREQGWLNVQRMACVVCDMDRNPMRYINAQGIGSNGHTCGRSNIMTGI